MSRPPARADEPPFNHTLATALRRHAGAQLAGSIYAVPAPRRRAVARLLAREQMWVHADVFSPASSGVDPVLVGELSASGVHPIDVHLVTSQSLDHLDAMCRAGVARVTFPYEGVSDAVAVAAKVRSAGAAAWLAIAPQTSLREVTGLRDRMDGLLVMLIQPGTRARADLRMLGKVAAAARAWECVGVDGGVEEQNVARVLEAGAGYVVIGRRLLSIARPQPDPDTSPRAHHRNRLDRRDTHDQ